MQSRFRDWGDIRLFLAVARKGATLAAARDLGMTQTTVSRRIDALEHALGLTLFDRDTRGFRLTEDGAALLEAAEGLEQAAQAFEQAAEARRRVRSKPIRFTAATDSMNTELADVFAEFAAEHPGIVFEFFPAERPLDLVAGEADVALRVGMSQIDDRLICRRIATTRWTYYASRRYAESRALPTSMDDRAGHTVVILNHVPSTFPNLLRCETAVELAMAIRSGLGIGALVTFLGDRDATLVRCFDPPENSDLPICLLTSPAAHRRPEVRRFTAFAAPRFAQYFKARDTAAG